MNRVGVKQVENGPLPQTNSIVCFELQSSFSIRPIIDHSLQSNLSHPSNVNLKASPTTTMTLLTSNRIHFDFKSIENYEIHLFIETQKVRRDGKWTAIHLNYLCDFLHLSFASPPICVFHCALIHAVIFQLLFSFIVNDQKGHVCLGESFIINDLSRVNWTAMVRNEKAVFCFEIESNQGQSRY